MTSILVKAFWDDEAAVWVATSEDVPGLVTEAESFDRLMQRLKALIPELLDENGYADSDGAHPFRVVAECHAVAERIVA